MTTTVVIAGATGFIGQHLRDSFDADGVEVRTIGRGAGDCLLYTSPSPRD